MGSDCTIPFLGPLAHVSDKLYNNGMIVARANSGPLLLLVDDSEMIRRTVRRQLRDGLMDGGPAEERRRSLAAQEDGPALFHTEFIEAADGKEALRILTGRAQACLSLPDLIISDLDMAPGMGGEEFIGEIRALPSLRAIPVVLCSGEHDVHERAARLEVLSFRKGDNPRGLLGIVRAALKALSVVA